MARIVPPSIARPDFKRRVLPNENLSLMMLSTDDIKIIRGGELNNDPSNKINIGDVVVLQEPCVEGMGEPEVIFFKVNGFVREINGVDISSYILKEVSPVTDEHGNVTFEDGNPNSTRQKLTIGRKVCSIIGVEYENGLELWSSAIGFVKYEDFIEGTDETRPIDYGNMATYPCDITNGLFNKICIEVTGFKFNSDTTVTTPYGTTMTMGNLFHTFAICFKGEKLIPLQYQAIGRGEEEKINPKSHTFNFEVDVSRLHLNPNDFEGVNIDDVLEVSWFEEVKTPERLYVDVTPHAVNVNRNGSVTIDRNGSVIIDRNGVRLSVPNPNIGRIVGSNATVFEKLDRYISQIDTHSQILGQEIDKRLRWLNEL